MNKKFAVRSIVIVLVAILLGTLVVGFSSTDSQAQETLAPAIPVSGYHLDATTSTDGYFLVCPSAPAHPCSERHFASWIRIDSTDSSVVTVQLTNAKLASAWRTANSNGALLGQMESDFDATTQTITVTLDEGQDTFLIYVSAADGINPYGINAR